MISAIYASDRAGKQGSTGLSARLGRVACCSLAALLQCSCGGRATDGSSDSSATSGVPDTDVDQANPTASAAGSPLAQRIATTSFDSNALRGARLYDNFYEEHPEIGFRPDDPATPEIDGSGGPFGDGTLPDGGGVVLDNAPGHGYRLSNIFGWDLRGAEGISGPTYQDSAYVAHLNLLDSSLNREGVAEVVADGAQGVPAYARVLSEQDLGDVVAFIMAVRGGEWVQPGDVWHLDAAQSDGYILNPGGRVEVGRTAIRSSCGSCHGPDGTSLLLHDGQFSLGSLARSSANEVWFKMLAGSPGTSMTSQISLEDPWPAQAQKMLDVLAALCDPVAYPLGGASGPDSSTEDGCGYYPH
jgi:mono/diheme cytochrome c family protein